MRKSRRRRAAGALKERCDRAVAPKKAERSRERSAFVLFVLHILAYIPQWALATLWASRRTNISAEIHQPVAKIV